MVEIDGYDGANVNRPADLATVAPDRRASTR